MRLLPCLLFLATLATSLSMADPAAADTIYLKNGRVIRSEWTRVEGNRLLFGQYGGQVAIPLEAIERVEKDALSGPVPTTSLSPEDYRARVKERRTAAAQRPATQEDEEPREEDLSPRDTPEYWQQRLETIQDRIAKIEGQLERLPEYRRSEEFIFRFDGRVLWVIQERERLEARLERARQSLRSLREEARHAGIPPGWFRASPIFEHHRRHPLPDHAVKVDR